ncbi:MAG: Methicillin resistance protein [Candidatus Gottesmanbacteria bacterium GW2011_GWA2_43_14]|uniref:Methicillin resistance protein n=1 Tax=Candidatus Gottesmanbacteria bacterium GW2011_GWA2_43_14 TaxID=1618443 RepID=A0A0G1DKY1_9BACT|nr:MAG: Methicillin resistance protein [Candidatus Gottesmanbacteria bacterium GW2011_GWA2_43_14]
MKQHNPARDIRQSDRFASFMEGIGWKTVVFNSRHVYLRKFPLIGSFAKCPRPDSPLLLTGLNDFLKKNRIYRFKISPHLSVNSVFYKKEKKKLQTSDFRINTDPYNPTTTIIVDLTRSEDAIFKSFSEAKRRAVRRALKNEIKVELSEDLKAFIAVRKSQFYPMGFLIAGEMKKLWQNFYPEKADLLLAKTREGKTVAGILLLYHNSLAYYWYAAALPLGKKLFAPSLLVWEAVKRAKKRGAKVLDFEGVYDGRFPVASESWRGFTKFKEGFSDKKVVLMENFSR